MPTWADFVGGSWGEKLLLVSLVLLFVGVPIWAITRSYIQPALSKIRFRASQSLAGTAQVLSVKSTGTILENTAYVCKIALRVQVPGREPYDVTIKQPIDVSDMSLVQPGETVSVQVAAKNPRKVRIGSGRSGSSSEPAPASSPTFNPTLDQKLSQLDKLRDSGRYTDEQAEFIRRSLMAEAQPNQAQQTPNTGGSQIPGVVAILASGQRVPGVLMAFNDNGHSTDSSFSIPELRDAPFYVLTIELHIPNLAPMTARNSQPVPPAVVPKLALGLQLTCAVDPANPAKLFAVDWNAGTG